MNHPHVAIVGATGAVGVEMLLCLEQRNFPLRKLTLLASARSAGKKMIFRGEEISVEELTHDSFAGVDIALFSAGGGISLEFAPSAAAAGAVVIDNSSAFRMDADVPLVVPEINPQAAKNRPRGIIANPNCTTIISLMALAPLHEAFGVRSVFAATMQAVSGAGYPGVASLDILGNVIPYIGDEEPKIEHEMQKMLGRLVGTAIEPAPFVVSAHANRVAVENGHTIVMSIGFERKPTADEAIAVVRAWRGAREVRGLPSAPEIPLRYADEPNRPQPRRDAMLGNGMTVSVGRIREDSILHIKLVAMAHNTIRGAAGGSILNAELLVARGFLPRAGSSSA